MPPTGEKAPARQSGYGRALQADRVPTQASDAVMEGLPTAMRAQEPGGAVRSIHHRPEASTEGGKSRRTVGAAEQWRSESVSSVSTAIADIFLFFSSE